MKNLEAYINRNRNLNRGYRKLEVWKESIQFNSISLASLSENYTQIISLLSSGDLDELWFNEYDKKHYSIENKLINNNKSLVERNKNSGDWNTDYKISEMISPYLQSNIDDI